MSRPKIFIDGREGTTGLQIDARLAARGDLTLLTIGEAERKDPQARRERMAEADLVFLCLPDAAAVEAVALMEGLDTRIIDASTAHRTDPAWAYGFPELSSAHRERIRTSRLIADPGCHATGFLSSVYPLTARGLLSRDAALDCFSLTGYSGGGKKMIAQYEGEKTGDLYSPRIYGLDQMHKHLPEMRTVCGLSRTPSFLPVVDDYYKGMATTVFLHSADLGGADAETVWEALSEHYAGEPLIHVAPLGYDRPMIAANTAAGRDDLTLIVYGEGERVCVTALFDNLGKGASGAAVQNMDLALGLPETEGLYI